MSSSGFDNNSYHIQEKLVVNRWTAPIEAFVPIPEYAEPLETFRIDNRNLDTIHEVQNFKPEDNSVVIAHETTQAKASDIMKNGFCPSNEEMSSLRDRAVFGWISQEDFGYFKKDTDNNCDTIVLFKAPKRRVYLSSYDSSAYLLGIGEIKPDEYEREHVMNYIEFEELITNYPSMLSHLNYNIDEFLNI